MVVGIDQKLAIKLIRLEIQNLRKQKKAGG